jgi:hypothetical protein
MRSFVQPARATADGGAVVDLLLGLGAAAAAFGRALAMLAAERGAADATVGATTFEARFVDVLLGLAALAERVAPWCAAPSDVERDAPATAVTPPSLAELLR